MGGAHSMCGERRTVCRVLVGKQYGKRPLGRPKLRWEDNIKMDLHEMGGGMDWIDLAQNKEVTNPRQRGNEPSGSKNCGEFLE